MKSFSFSPVTKRVLLQVIKVESSFLAARGTVSAAGLDIIVYIDNLSEPISYFLQFSRIAPVQVSFRSHILAKP